VFFFFFVFPNINDNHSFPFYEKAKQGGDQMLIHSFKEQTKCVTEFNLDATTHEQVDSPLRLVADLV